MEEDQPAFYYYLNTAWLALASVGWYLVIVIVTIFCAAPYIGEKYREWRHKKDEEEYSTQYHKDPDAFAERLRDVDAARQRLQEKYSQQAEIAKEREEERKALKRQELLKLANDNKGGRKLGTNDGESSSTSPQQQDYNPLMGNSSRGYRPPKRSCCGKGGCG